MNIIKNTISEDKQELIEKIMLSSEMPWYYQSSTVYDTDVGIKADENTVDTPQFTHILINNGEVNSQFKWVVDPLLDFLNVPIENIIRVKCNLITCHQNYPENSYQVPHRDYIDEKKEISSLLYYVNNCDGETFFFDCNQKITERVIPERGKSVRFDPNMLHAGSPPRKHKNRIVINFIFRNS